MCWVMNYFELYFIDMLFMLHLTDLLCCNQHGGICKISFNELCLSMRYLFYRLNIQNI